MGLDFWSSWKNKAAFAVVRANQKNRTFKRKSDSSISQLSQFEYIFLFLSKERLHPAQK